MKVSEILQQFINSHQESEISIRSMTHYFGERAFGFLLLIFALICVVPLPIPGIHMLLSIPLFYLSIQQAIGRHEVWFPQKIMDYKIPNKAFHEMVGKTLPWIKRIEKISRPRLEFLTRGGFFCFVGMLVFYITAFLSIPLPLTNLVPGIAIMIIALGILNRDGIAIIIGSAVGIAWSLLWFYIFWKTFMFFLTQVMELAVKLYG